MKYAMLIYMDETRWDAQPASARERIEDETTAYTKKYVDSGQIVAGAALRGVWSATTLRKRNGELVMDGPFTESKEVIAGFQLMECKDLDEAIAVGGAFPGLDAGLRCELRPVADGCSELRGDPSARPAPRS